MYTPSDDIEEKDVRGPTLYHVSRVLICSISGKGDEFSISSRASTADGREGADLVIRGDVVLNIARTARQTTMRTNASSSRCLPRCRRARCHWTQHLRLCHRQLPSPPAPPWPVGSWCLHTGQELGSSVEPVLARHLARRAATGDLVQAHGAGGCVSCGTAQLVGNLVSSPLCITTRTK
jgi:hypothetical protein